MVASVTNPGDTSGADQMSIRITVRSSELRQRTKKATGEIFANEQVGYAWLFDRSGKPEEFPVKVTLTHWVRNGKPESDAYPPGEYTLHPASFTVGDYGTLNCSPRLVPVQTGAKS
jgi:hypothetical protein